MSVGALDIDAIRGSSWGKRRGVIDGLRKRQDPVLAMRDTIVAAAAVDQDVKVATAQGTPWVAIATPDGLVDWHRRSSRDGDPIVDVLVEVVAALHGDGVSDPSTGPIAPPERA